MRKKTKNVYEVTPFGHFMRYLRGRTGELGVNMADTLGISREYLVQLELGVRGCHVPLHVVKKIKQKYYLSSDELKKFKEIIRESNRNMHSLSFSNVSDDDKQKILDYAYNLMLK